ncbi:hypothetical protein, partial [Thiolapillus sp.]
DSAFDNLFVPQPSWSPSTTQQLRKLVAAPYLAPNDWTPRSEAYFVFPLAQGTPGKQCGLAATGVYQPSLRSPWLAAKAVSDRLDLPGEIIGEFKRQIDVEILVLRQFTTKTSGYHTDDEMVEQLLRVPMKAMQILLESSSRVDRPLLAFTLTEPDVRISRIRLFRAGHPD